jgi:hypothetical protein
MPIAVSPVVVKDKKEAKTLMVMTKVTLRYDEFYDIDEGKQYSREYLDEYDPKLVVEWFTKILRNSHYYKSFIKDVIVEASPIHGVFIIKYKLTGLGDIYPEQIADPDNNKPLTVNGKDYTVFGRVNDEPIANVKPKANVAVAKSKVVAKPKEKANNAKPENIQQIVNSYKQFIGTNLKMPYLVSILTNGSISIQLLTIKLTDSTIIDIIEKSKIDITIDGKEYIISTKVVDNQKITNGFIFIVKYTLKSKGRATPKPAAVKGECVKSDDKKYAGRPSPPYPANECRGQVILGNDGKMYISKPTASGVYRWVRT